MTDAYLRACEEEQAHLDLLYSLLDAERLALHARLDGALRGEFDDEREQFERDVEVTTTKRRIAQLAAVGSGLLFGRIDVDTPGNALERRHIGLIGVGDPTDPAEQLLIDWRAPQARAFYLATPAHPDGVVRRRHIRTNSRTVTGLSDESFLSTTADAVDSVSSAQRTGDVGNENVLIDMLNRARGEHMRDIVTTIQREQDAIIRDDFRGVTVVEGGPGTGKTAVALHRAAYVLYTFREQLSGAGVLIIGPNLDFLTYISQVLPTLGEHDVVLSTVDQLLPGVTADRTEADPLIREVKGSAEMRTLLVRAVRSWETVPEEDLTVDLDGLSVTFRREAIARARTLARRSKKPHNRARSLFIRTVLDDAVTAVIAELGADVFGTDGNVMDAADQADLRTDIAGHDLTAALWEQWWPELTPEDVLRELVTNPARLATITHDYDELTAEALAATGEQLLEVGTATAAESAAARYVLSDCDIPLIDELAVILGERRSADQTEQQQWREQLEEAQQALDLLAGSAVQDLDDGTDAEILMAYDVIDAAELARRQQHRIELSTAQRARADRQWAYGYVIVDEAQELSAMAWRMIMRRCPSKWMTLVGDIAQTSDAAGSDSWASTLEPFVDQRWQHHRLTVNYRTPAEVMELAAVALRMIDPHAIAPQSVRSTGRTPQVHELEELSPAELVSCVAGIRAAVDPARSVAVILSHSVYARVAAELTEQLPTVRVLDTIAAKGLEFDEVVVVEPQLFLEDSVAGWQDLYVALTRCTQQVHLLTAAGLPAELS